MPQPAQKTDRAGPARGLRESNKARRRAAILAGASGLFSEKGVDATTMAEIAEVAGVTPPTIFNHFGTKDGILISLVTQGIQNARPDDFDHLARTDMPFGAVMADYFTLLAERTLKIASKRVWRYAESATIRHPTTELARKYETLDEALIERLTHFLGLYDLRPARDRVFLARLFYECWNAAFFDLIKEDARTLDQHRADLHDRFLPLAEMLFAPEFAAAPTLKTG